MQELIAICQHCGNKTSHDILNTVNDAEEIRVDQDVYELKHILWFTNCKTCKHHSLFSMIEGDIAEPACCFPRESYISHDVPLEIRSVYSEALKVRRHSSYAFTILIRKALEITCQLEKASGRDLFAKIQDLGKKNILPQKMTEMADLIRLIGNTGAHSNELHVDESDLNALNDFFVLIVEYIYGIKRKMEGIRAKLNISH